MTTDVTDGRDEPLTLEHRSIYLEVMFERPADPAATKTFLRRWFDQGLDMLGAGLPDEILGGPPLDRRMLNHHGPIGDPFTPWGNTFVYQRQPDGNVRRTSAVFSTSALQRLHKALGSPDLRSAELNVCRLDKTGRYHRSSPHLMLYYQAVDDDFVYPGVHGDWIRLAAMFDAVLLFDKDFFSKLKVFAWSNTRECNPAFGVLDYRFRSTRLEDDLASASDENLPFMREHLRGYGWLTVIPQEIGDALGGSDGLVNSRAFAAVTSLGGGGYLLQATHKFGDYTPARAHRVQEALTPHLINHDIVLEHRTAVQDQYTSPHNG